MLQAPAGSCVRRPDGARLSTRVAEYVLADGTSPFGQWFERLARASGKPAKSLNRMLSSSGNPSMDNLAVIFGAIRRELGVDIRVRTIRAA